MGQQILYAIIDNNATQGNIVVSNLPADGEAPLGATTYVATMITRAHFY